jgi:hypothetical protein
LLSQEVRQQRRALRRAGSAVALLVVLLGLLAWQWNVARTQRNRAEHTLTLATQTANSLVFDLAQRFKNLGLPAAVAEDILTRARNLQDQLAAAGNTPAYLRRSQAEALLETADTLLTLGKTSMTSRSAITISETCFRLRANSMVRSPHTETAPAS